MKRLQNVIRTLTRNSLLLVMTLGITSGLAGFAVIRGLSEQQVNASSCDVICVSLKSDGMHPNELAIKRGETVQFNSADGQFHNISEGNGAHGSGHGHSDDKTHEHKGEYLSGEFGPDEAWRVQFNKIGTYELHDHYNPKQSILVVVYDES